MTMTERVPLPVTALPRRDECGQGLLFRVAHMNGLRLRGLYQLAGAGLQASGADVSELAGIAGVGRSWLDRNLVQSFRTKGQRCQFLGRGWGSPLSIRSHRPQVCPECLRCQGYCSGAWTASGYVACHLHGLHLVDRCANCGRPISWNRPALTVCQCRWEIARGTEEHRHVDPVVLAWCKWVYRQLYDETVLPTGPAADQSDRWLLPRWLDGLGIEVAFLTLHAFGVRARQHQRIAPRDATAAISPQEVAVILGRGLERSRVLDHLRLSEILALDGWIYEEGIERLAHRAASAADRSFTATCRHAIRLANEHLQATGRPRQMYQPDLFEGSFYE